VAKFNNKLILALKYYHICTINFLSLRPQHRHVNRSVISKRLSAALIIEIEKNVLYNRGRIYRQSAYMVYCICVRGYRPLNKVKPNMHVKVSSP